MIYFNTSVYTLQPNDVVVIKEKDDVILDLYISNKTDELIELFFDNDNGEESTSGIVVKNKTFIFENNKVPRNKLRIKNVGTSETTVTVLWSK